MTQTGAGADAIYQKALRLARKGRVSDRPVIISLLKEAISGRHAEAAHALGTWYLHGVGMRRNYREGLRLEKIAAKSGISEAEYNVAISYELARGVPRNEGLAFTYYKRAARHGERDALYEISRCYWFGIGVAANRRLSDRWFEKAVRAGSEQALAARRT